MAIPIIQQIRVGAYIFKQKLLRRKNSMWRMKISIRLH